MPWNEFGLRLHRARARCVVWVLTKVISSVTEGAGTPSSIVCRTAAGAGAGQVPLKVVIDELEVTTAKRFLYKKNPVIKSVKPLCSLQR